MEKTNAMRILERAGAEYKVHTYEGGALSGKEVAAVLGQDPGRAFKTLVTVGSPRKYYVFVIPVAAELDLKKAAKAAGEKSVEMLPQKELFPLTGYVHGGCVPHKFTHHFFIKPCVGAPRLLILLPGQTQNIIERLFTF